jgi:hypothetical protein
MRIIEFSSGENRLFLLVVNVTTKLKSIVYPQGDIRGKNNYYSAADERIHKAILVAIQTLLKKAINRPG